MEESSLENLQTLIMNLPDDCLVLIFQFLDCLSDRESFGLTCRRWLQVQNLCRLSLQFGCSFNHLSLTSLSHPNFNVTSTHLTRFLDRFRHLQTLSLSGCINLPDSSLTALSNYGASLTLQALHFDYCCNITDEGFSLAFKACPSLTIVSLYRCSITDIGVTNLAKFCQGLNQVNLSYCYLVSDQGLAALSRACRQLRAVRMSFCGGVTGVGFAGCSPTLAQVEAVSCNNLDPVGVEAIVSSGGVEYLDVSLSWRFGGSGLASLTAAAGLEILNLRLCRSVGDASVSAIAKGCPLLREWSLASCQEVTVHGWESIGANCGKLERLHVNGCMSLGDRGLLALRNGCQRLAVLYVTRCAAVTKAAIEMFKSYRADVVIKEEEIVCIGPKMPFR